MIRWLSWGAHHPNAAGGVHCLETIVRPTFSDQPELPQVMARTLASLCDCLRVLDTRLDGREWLVGDHLSHADFRVAPLMPYAAQARLPVADYRYVLRHAGQLDALRFRCDPFAGR